MKTLPQFAAATPEQAAQMKQAFASMSFELTADTMISVMGPQRKEESYKVVKIEGDSLFTDSTDAAGKVDHSKCDLGKDGTMAITNLEDSNQQMVVKKKAAA